MRWYRQGWQRQEDRVRRGTAAVRGAALAMATVATAVREQLTRSDCPDGDIDCLRGRHDALLAQRRRVAEVADEVGRLERTAVSYDGPVPADAPRLGGQEPTVIAARALVDRAHDSVLEALNGVRAALALLDTDPLLGGGPA